MLYVFLLYFYFILSTDKKFDEMITFLSTPENSEKAYKSLEGYFLSDKVTFELDVLSFRLIINCNMATEAHIPDGIELLSKVRRLVVECCGLVDLPWGLGKLKHLVVLNLSRNYLCYVPGCIYELERLEELNLEENYIAILCDQIKLLTNLRYLELRRNLIVKIYSTFKNIETLTRLCFDHNIGILRLNIEEPSTEEENQLFSCFPLNLEYLSLKAIRLCFLPEIFAFVKLRFLDVSQNFIVHWPLNFGDVKFLTILNLSDNSFLYINESIGNLEDLNYLDISNNNIKEFYDESDQYNSLETLNLNDNPLIRLSMHKTSFKKLKKLRLDNIVLQEFQVLGKNIQRNNVSGFYKENTHILKTLRCKFDSLDSIEDVFKFTGLTNLSIRCISTDFFRTQVRILSGLDHLLKLRILVLENCGLYRFPDQIFSLTRLKTLSLAYNKIKYLPLGIENLPLENLDFQSNELEIIPLTFCKSTKLVTLCLKDNKIEYLPKNIGEVNFDIDLTGNAISLFGKDSRKGLLDIPYNIVEKICLDEDQLFLDYDFHETKFYQQPHTLIYNWNYIVFLKVKSQEVQEHSLGYAEIEMLYNKLEFKLTTESLRNSTLKYLRKVYQIEECANHVSTNYGEEQRNILKKYIEEILKTLQLHINNDENLIENYFIILEEAYDVCFDGQLEHLVEVLKILKNSDISCLKNFIYNFIAQYKYDTLKRITSANSFDQNVHILSYWRNKLCEIFGFEKIPHLFVIDINNVLLNSNHYILYQMFKELE
ncbi:Leucine rich repeat protein, partial [Spraguea lophii 42_110]